MGGNNMQKKSSSSSSFSLFGLFKGRRSSKARRSEDCEYVNRAYKVYPSDEDRGLWWVAEPRIDDKASAYISHVTGMWGKDDDIAN